MVCFGSRTSQVQILPPRLDCRVDCDDSASPTPSASVLPVCYFISGSTAWALLTLVVALCFFTGPDLSNAASAASPASRSVGISSSDLATTHVRVLAIAARDPERAAPAHPTIAARSTVSLAKTGEAARTHSVGVMPPSATEAASPPVSVQSNDGPQTRGTARPQNLVQRRMNVIRSVFGVHGAAAVRVARCESGPLLDPRARNGRYLGTFQMGDAERRRFGHGPGVRHQALAAWRYFRLAGWRPWSCAYRV